MTKIDDIRYKQTEFGLIPDDWKVVRLEEVCEINPSRPKSFTRFSDAPTTFIPMAAVDEKTGTVAKVEVVPYSKVSKGYTYFEENDVLFAKITPCMQNGKHVIARNLIDGIGFGTTEFHVLRPKNEVLPEWIYFFIRQSYFLQEATAYFTGAVGQQRIPEYFLADYIIPLPPLEDQHRIASKIQELMQEIYNLKSAIRNQFEAAKALSSAYLREVFESEEAKKWERKRLGEVCEVEKGKTPSESHYAEKGFRIIKYRDIKDDRTINWETGFRSFVATKHSQSLRLLTSKTTLIGADAHDPSSIGKKVAYVESIPPGIGICYYSGELIGIRVMNENMMNSYWPFLWFISDYGYRVVQTFVDGVHLNKGQAIQMPIPLPPIQEQHRITTYLKEKMAQVENLQSSIYNQQLALDVLPQAILRKAFRGELKQ